MREKFALTKMLELRRPSVSTRRFCGIYLSLLTWYHGILVFFSFLRHLVIRLFLSCFEDIEEVMVIASPSCNIGREGKCSRSGNFNERFARFDSDDVRRRF